MKKTLTVIAFNLFTVIAAFGQSINWQWARNASGPGDQEGLVVQPERAALTGEVPPLVLAFVKAAASGAPA